MLLNLNKRYDELCLFYNSEYSYSSFFPKEDDCANKYLYT